MLAQFITFFFTCPWNEHNNFGDTKILERIRTGLESVQYFSACLMAEKNVSLLTTYNVTSFKNSQVCNLC